MMASMAEVLRAEIGLRSTTSIWGGGRETVSAAAAAAAAAEMTTGGGWSSTGDANSTAEAATLVSTVTDLAAYVETHLGSRYRSPVESIVLTVVYAIILTTGVVGNVSTCVVIIKNGYMHTATNSYLFSLAISDVLTLILGESARSS